MFISRVILFAFKNWKIASRYGFASGVSRPLEWLERLTGDQKVAGSIPVWGSETFF